MHWLSIPALPSVMIQQVVPDGGASFDSSEAKHVVQAEGAAANEAMIAEQAARRIAHNDAAILARGLAFVGAERLAHPPQCRTAAVDLAVEHFVGGKRYGVAAFQIAECVRMHRMAVLVEDGDLYGKMVLDRRHRCRQHDAPVAFGRQNRRGKDKALAEQVAQLRQLRIELQILALDIGMSDAAPAVLADDFITW